MLKTRLAIVLAVLLAATLPADAGKAIRIQLKDGSKIRGRIEAKECTEKMLVVRELRTRAKRTIPWEQILDDQARQLRVKLGFEAAEDEEELTVKGHRIRNKAGNRFTGILLNESDARSKGYYVLKTSNGPRRVPLRDVAKGPDPVSIPALEVYTPEELYEQRTAEPGKDKSGRVLPGMGKPKTVQDHFQLADFCYKVGALVQAKDHYLRVMEWPKPENRYNLESVKRRIDRVEILLGQAEARAALQDIRRSILVTRKFGKAKSQIEAFKEKYADTPELIAAAEKMAERLGEERDKHFIKEVNRELLDRVKKLLEEKAGEEELAFSEALKYAEGVRGKKDGVTYEAVEALATQLGLESREVYDYWDRRPKKHIYSAFFKDGTFIFTKPEDPLKKAGRPKGGGAVKRPKPRPKMTPERWFEIKYKKKSRAALRDFLYAWWAQHSEMVQLMDAKTESCSVCAGRGYKVNTRPTKEGMISYFDRCVNCHGAKEWHVVRFK